MRKLGVIFCMMTMLSLAACGAKQENPEVPEPTVNAEQNAGTAETVIPTEAPKRTIIPAHTDYLTEKDMQTASPWQVCDNTALAAVMKKAEAGEPVTIATIGGSITQGSI